MTTSLDALLAEVRVCRLCAAHLEPRPVLRVRPTASWMGHPSWRNTGWLARNPWFADELLPVLRQRVAEALAGPATP